MAVLELVVAVLLGGVLLVTSAWNIAESRGAAARAATYQRRAAGHLAALVALADVNAAKAARLGYEAYGQSTGGRTFDGRPMPTWDELPDRIRRAWTAAASAVLLDALEAAIKARAELDPEAVTAPFA